MNRTTTESMATTSISQQAIESAAQISRLTISTSDNGSELSDLNFLSMSAKEYEASALAPGAVLGRRPPILSRGSGVMGRVREIDGSESDIYSWSLADRAG